VKPLISFYLKLSDYIMCNLFRIVSLSNILDHLYKTSKINQNGVYAMNTKLGSEMLRISLGWLTPDSDRSGEIQVEKAAKKIYHKFREEAETDGKARQLQR